MENVIFIAMVGTAVCLLTLALVVPVFGEARQTRKRLKARLKDVEAEVGEGAPVNLMRKRYLKNLSPMERSLESLPGMETLGDLLRDGGWGIIAYRFALLTLLLSALVAAGCWLITGNPWLTALLAAVALVLPYLKLTSARNKRMMLFEEQLPDALDVMRRALQAGHPFSETLHLVGTEMKPPIATEFEYTFNDLNYGGDLRAAMLGLLERVPSVTVMALVTSVLVQKETGGNMAEILDNISRVIRGRFRFHRRVRTLSAEGRLSAWILVLVPFALFVVLSFMKPDYLPVLTEDEGGRTLIAWAFGLMVVGIFWIRRVIRIEV